MLIRIFTSLAIFLTLTAHAEETPKALPATQPLSLKAENESWRSVRLHPLYLLLGGMRADLNFQLGDSAWFLGPSVQTVDYDYWIFGGKMKANGFGLNSLYAFSGSPLKRSFYVSPQVHYLAGEVGYNGILSSAKGNFKAYEGILAFGYQWMWKHVGLNIGGGMTYTQAEVSNITGDVNLLWTKAKIDDPKATNVSSWGYNIDFGVSFPF